ncbi:hypothetical protein L0337_05330 [candidate division KSB1 bacterium]|nr:hypothetical protein [candidate division KSB1 bacterium]
MRITFGAGALPLKNTRPITALFPSAFLGASVKFDAAEWFGEGLVEADWSLGLQPSARQEQNDRI